MIVSFLYFNKGSIEENIMELISNMKQKASLFERTVKFGLRVHVIVRETEEQAREDARKLISKLDLELGKVKLKFGGGNGGHNGLSSIDEMIGNNYHRVRIGIDHPGTKDLVSNFVLNKYHPNQNIDLSYHSIILDGSSNFPLYQSIPRNIGFNREDEGTISELKYKEKSYITKGTLL